MVAGFPSEISGISLFLGSRSPRRLELLRAAGFEVFLVDCSVEEECFPENLSGGDIPMFLARKKAEAFQGELPGNGILVTADTIVWLDGQVLGKPASREEARDMLRSLSGRSHEVFTGVFLRYRSQSVLFYAETKVFFRALLDREIAYYVDTFKPYDKAGAYGIQEWIGYVGVERIDGSYYNVMGLPLQMLYTKINQLVLSV